MHILLQLGKKNSFQGTMLNMQPCVNPLRDSYAISPTSVLDGSVPRSESDSSTQSRFVYRFNDGLPASGIEYVLDEHH